MNRHDLVSRLSMLVLLFATWGSIVAGADEEVRNSGDCGPVALYALFRLEGRPTSIEAIAARLPKPRPESHSMRQLRDASRSLGLILDGAYLGKDTGPIDRPMIVFLKVDREGHFLVIRPVGHTGKLVQVIDANQPTRVMEKAELIASDQWTGLVLAPRRANWPMLASLGLLGSTGLGLLAFAFSRGRKRSSRDLTLSA